MTDLVAVDAPEPLATLPGRARLSAARRAADEACRRRCRGSRLPHRRAITVDGIADGRGAGRDRLGRDLPVWQGCRRIADGEVFLMNWTVRDSLDGRYFGPLPASSIIGRAVPLWTDEDGDGRFEWRAATR